MRKQRLSIENWHRTSPRRRTPEHQPVQYLALDPQRPSPHYAARAWHDPNQAGRRDRFLVQIQAVRSHSPVDCESYFGMYRQIAFPLVPPALPTIARLTFMGVWNGSFVPLGYLAPLRDYQTLTSVLIRYSKRFQTLYHIMAADAAIALGPVIVVFMFLQHYFVRGVTEGATKG